MSVPAERFVDGAGLRLHAVDYGGSGRALVLLHGGSAHARWWDFVAPALTRAFHVIALDLRGHGDSDPSPTGAYRVADYAADLDPAFASLGIGRPVLVGHSLGSFVAQRYAIDHPGALAALVVVDGRVVFGASGSRYMKLLRMLPTVGYATLEEAVRHFQLLPRETVASPEVLAKVARRSFREAEPGRWVAKFDRATLAAHEPFDFERELATLSCPVLFVRGEHSRVLSRDAAVRFAAACRRGEWAEIAGAHHHVPLDRPTALASEILAFLGRRLPAETGV